MTVNLHGISRESFDLIVNEEVSGRAAYEKKYKRPEKPGGQSGVTVGIGYDCGYATADTIRKDWVGKIPNPMVEALASCAGIKGDAAFAACRRVRDVVSVPWEAAIEVFSNVSIPKYMAATRKALPGYDNLAPDCKGSILSLTYNRGASYTIPASQDRTGRYREMRDIRAAMIAGNLATIPGLLRSMARLWTSKSVRGVALRREHEARLFEKGLAGRQPAAPEQPMSEHDDENEVAAPFPADPPQPDPQPAPPNVQPVDPSVLGDPVLFDVQTRLKARRYPPGVLDGKWGSGTSGALSGFMNDRGLRLHLPTSLAEFHEIADEVRAELLEAETEVQPDGSTGWYRPVSPARANADSKIVKELAPETVPAKRNFLVTLWGAISAFFAAIWDTISGYVSEAWNFFTDHKDVVDDHPGIASSVWGYVTSVPSEVWLIAGGCGLLFVAYNSWQAIKTSTLAVQNGERQ